MRALLVTVLLGAPAGADTLLVGPPITGAAFEQVQDALDVAAPGDVVLVAPGTFDAFEVRVPVTVIGQEPSQTRVVGGADGWAVAVRDVGAGQVVLSGLGVEAGGSDAPALSIDAAGAVVVVSDLDVVGGAGGAPAVEVLAGFVALTASQVAGSGAALRVAGADVAVADCELTAGGDAPAIALVGARLDLARGRARGGGEALELVGSAARVSGGGLELQAGPGHPAVRALGGSSIVLAPDVVLTTDHVDPVALSRDSHRRDLAAPRITIAASPAFAQPGGTSTLSIDGPPGADVLVAISAAPLLPPALREGLGPILANPAAGLVLRVSLDATGSGALVVDAPSCASPCGSILAAQATAPRAPAIGVSNLAVIAVKG